VGAVSAVGEEDFGAEVAVAGGLVTVAGTGLVVGLASVVVAVPSGAGDGRGRVVGDGGAAVATDPAAARRVGVTPDRAGVSSDVEPDETATLVAGLPPESAPAALDWVGPAIGPSLATTGASDAG
jgi:hypothetical protein